jgi:hypothetical protein
VLSAVGDLHGFDPGRSRRQAEAAEPSPDGSLGGHHPRGSPPLLRWQASLLGDEPPDGIDSLLDLGHPVLVGMNLEGGGTHFVTLTGLDGQSDYWVNDPWEQNAMHVKFSGGWGDRGEVYEAIAFI